MIRLALLALWLCGLSSFAQTISGAEYFLNSDPGAGNGMVLSIAAGDSVATVFDFPTQNLAAGFHKLYVRYQDDEGRWGRPNGRLLYVAQEREFAQNSIAAGEYFLDNDPGVGLATPTVLTSGDSVSTALELPIAGLSPGFHKLYFRYRDANNRWGRASGRLIYVAPTPIGRVAHTLPQGEYFWNTDPGIGNGIPLTIIPDDSVFATAILTLEEFGPGFQRLYARYRDDSGRWGKAIGQLQYLFVSDTLREQYYISGAEYFVDTDPGVGSAIPLPPQDGLWDERDEMAEVTLTPYPLGGHRVGIRFRDNLNRWSITVADSFIVGPVLTVRVSGPHIVLDWTGGSSSQYYIHAATNFNGPYQLLDSTASQNYIHSNAATLPDLKRYYRLTHWVE